MTFLSKNFSGQFYYYLLLFSLTITFFQMVWKNVKIYKEPGGVEEIEENVQQVKSYGLGAQWLVVYARVISRVIPKWLIKEPH